jgi:hypothetical protein
MINDTPEDLIRFRPEEIGGLSINDEVTTNFGIVKLLPKFTNLKALRLEMNVDNTYLRYIDQLPALEELDVSNSLITGSGLVKLTRFRKLDTLNCACIDGGKDKLIDALKNTKISNLKFEGLDLTELDLKKIASLKTLKELYIGGNPQINDEALRCLANHPTLTHLDVSATSVSAHSLKTFQSIKNLVYLKFSKEQIPVQQLNYLQRNLGKCVVEED